MRSTRPMMRSWLRTSRTLYHNECWCVWPVESAMATVRNNSKCIARDRESPRRTTRSVLRLRLVIDAGRRWNNWRKTKLLRCAPVSNKPVVKGTGGLLSGIMIKPERMNGWQSSVDVVDVAEASWDKRAVEMIWSGSKILGNEAGWSSIESREGPAMTYLL